MLQVGPDRLKTVYLYIYCEYARVAETELLASSNLTVQFVSCKVCTTKTETSQT